MALKMAKPASMTAGLPMLLYWALTNYIVLLTPPITVHPNVSSANPLQLSLTHRILQTLFAAPKSSEPSGSSGGVSSLTDCTFFKDAQECWAVCRSLQLIGSFSGSGKVLGVTSLNITAAIPEPQRSSRAMGVRESKEAQLHDVVKSARGDLLALLETEEGRKWRERSLGLEIMWREVVRDWGNVTALEGLILRMEDALKQGCAKSSRFATILLMSHL